MRLIDADTILYWEDDSGIKNMGYVRKGQIDSMPTIEAKPVKHGRWFKTGQSFVHPDKFRNYVCSVCGFELDTQIRQEPNYCPNCGADMREVEGNYTINTELVRVLLKDEV